MKLLLITDDPAAETNLREHLEEIADGGELDVKVVAPLRPATTLDLVTGDIDDAKSGAEERALAPPFRRSNSAPTPPGTLS